MARRKEYNFIARGGADFSGINKEVRKLLKSLRGFGNSIKSALRPLSLVQRTVAKAVKPFVAVGRAIGRMGGALRRVLPGIRIFNRETGRASANMGMFSRGIVRLAAGIFVFNNVRKAMQSMINTTRALLRQHDEWNTSMNAVRVNLWTAFAPIWEAITPALLAFGNILARVTQTLATFVSILAGTTFEAARDAGEALYGQAKAYEAVGSAANAARRQLFGFDQINQVADNSGDSGIDAGLNFGAVASPDKGLVGWLGELAKNLRSLEPDLKYFHNLGYNLAAAIGRGLGNIPWNGIQNRVATWAKELASFLNGIVANDSFWTGLGSTLLGGIRTMLTGANNFMRQFQFYDFGIRIAEIFTRLIGILPELGETLGIYINSIFSAISGFIRNVDWQEAGAALSEGIGNFIGKVDWGAVGETIADGLNAAIRGLYGFVSTFNWSGLGTAMAASVNRFFDTFDWPGTARAIFGTLRGALETIYTFLSEVEWRNIGYGIRDFLIEVEWRELFEDVVRVMGAAFGALSDILEGAFGITLKDALIRAFAVVFTLKFLKKLFLKIALPAIFGGIKALDAKLLVWTNVASGKLIVAAINAAFTIKFFKKLFIAKGLPVIIGGLKALGAKLLGWLKVGLGKLVGTAIKAAFTIKFFTKMFIVKTLPAILGGLKVLGVKLLGWLKTALGKLLGGALKKILKLLGGWKIALGVLVFGIFERLWSYVRNFFDNMLGGIPIIGDIWNAIAGKIDTAVGVIRGVIDGIMQVFRGLIDFIAGVFSGDWERAWDGLVNIFAGIFNGITSIVAGVFNLVIGGINSGIRGAVAAINLLIRGVNLVPGVNINLIEPPQIPKIDIPRLASGAVIPPNSEFLAILGDQRRGTNIEAPLSTIEAAVSNVVGNMRIDPGDIAAIVNGINQSMAQMNSGSGQNNSQGRDVVLELNGYELARMMLNGDFQGAADRIGLRLMPV